MSEFFDGAAEAGGTPALERLSVCGLGGAIIACDGGLEHYDEAGNLFQDAKWNDETEIGKYYVLQRRTGATGSAAYSLRVFDQGALTEWYDFYDGLAHVCDHMKRVYENKRAARVAYAANYVRATGYLRSALATRGYVPPRAPQDALDNKPLSEAENQTFLALMGTL